MSNEAEDARRLRVHPIGMAVILITAALAASPAIAATNVNCSKHNLQDKIDAATAGETLSISEVCVGNFTIDKDLKLVGKPGATLDGDLTGSTLTITGDPKVALVNLTITGGKARLGGGIHHVGGPLTLRSVVVADNAARGDVDAGFDAAGAGIYSAAGKLTVRSSSIRNNVALGSSNAAGVVAAAGGGIYSNGPLEVIDSKIRNNVVRALSTAPVDVATRSSVLGGGVHAGSRSLVAGSVIEGNSASANAESFAVAGGAGLSAKTSDQPVEITGSRISHNTASASSSDLDASAAGGGLDISTGEATFRLSGTKLSENRALSDGTGGGSSARGGGLEASDSDVVLKNVRITDNIAKGVDPSSSANVRGGGAQFAVDTEVSLTSTTFARNTVRASGSSATGQGGAVAHDGTNGLIIRRSTFDRNLLAVVSNGGDATASGGAIYVQQAVAIDRSAVTRNSATARSQQANEAAASGGGIRILAIGVDATISNSTIAANSVNGSSPDSSGTTRARGGGVSALEFTGDVLLTNTTVARNAVAGSGGTLVTHGGGIFTEGGATTLQHSILGLNEAPTTADGPNCFGSLISGGHNAVGGMSGCIFTGQASDVVGTNPKLGPLANNGGGTLTLALKKGSPAINTIPKNGCLVAVDQRGVKRPQGNRCDSGAYERKV